MTPLLMQKVSPNIYVTDIHETIDFYRKLGFELTTQVGEGQDMIFALMSCGKVTFMFQTFKSIENTLPHISRTDGGSLLLYIDVNGIQDLYERVRSRVPVLHGLGKTFYGTTEFSIEDNNHYMITFAENEQD
jgi:catechol 2,3-dioxygenase-like lactoylglutathione lyase family enzyme